MELGAHRAPRPLSHVVLWEGPVIRSPYSAMAHLVKRYTFAS